MNTLKAEFRQGFIAGVSRSSRNTEIASGTFDVIILTSSWDARCLSIAAGDKLQAEYGLGIFFDARDKMGLRDKHDQVLNQFLKQNTTRQESISGESCDVKRIWEGIYGFLVKVRKAKRRTLRIFMDLSTCPRYYSLGVTAAAFVQSLAHSLTFFYAEAAYTEDTTKGELAFTSGRWATVSVPFLSGLFHPNKKLFYLVSAGFEGDKTFRALSRADPDRVSLMFANPGFCPEYETRALKANASLIQEFVIPKSQIINAPGADAIKTWQLLEQSKLHRIESENCCYMCCGTKPHALALALSAISSGSAAVLYNIPEEHRVHETRANGTFWTYTLKDVTAIE
jgi:hypothetical protein